MSEFGRLNFSESLADEALSTEEQEKLSSILDKAIETRNLLVESGVMPEAIFVVAHSLWDKNIIEKTNCWIITTDKELHHRATRYGIEYSVPYFRSTGFALSESGDIIHYRTDEAMGNNPKLVQYVGTEPRSHDNSQINPIEPELLLSDSVKDGLDSLTKKAIYYDR